jgi:hypothetical protein
MCRRSAEYANKPLNAAKAWTFVRNAAFRATPHYSDSRRVTLHLCRATPHFVPHNAAFVPQLLWQIPH